jgi:molecular chaperone GrpE
MTKLDRKKHPHEQEEPVREEALEEQAAPDEGGKEAVTPEELRAEMERIRAQADEYLNGWKRAQADLVNYRKRVERDALDELRSAAGQAAARFFPMLDDFERALKERPASQNLEQWAAGVELIYRKGIAALEAEGITPIDVSSEVHPDRSDGEVLEVVHTGYRMGDRVLRPAQVRVACQSAAGGDEGPNTSEEPHG